MNTPTPSQRVDEQERSASSMATYPGRVVKADFARTLAVELECAERDLAAAQGRIKALEGELANCKEFIASPPRHKYWGAGEVDCPSEIKAPNGELHTMRCKVCGLDNPRSEICQLATQKPSQHVAWLRYKIGKDGAATTVHLCNSDDDGAFKVYRAAHTKDAQ